MTLYFTPFGRTFRHYAAGRVATPELDETETCDVNFPLNVHVEADTYVLSALVPGVKADDLKIEIAKNEITVSGKLPGDASEGVQYLLQERPARLIQPHHPAARPGGFEQRRSRIERRYPDPAHPEGRRGPPQADQDQHELNFLTREPAVKLAARRGAQLIRNCAPLFF